VNPKLHGVDLGFGLSTGTAALNGYRTQTRDRHLFVHWRRQRDDLGYLAEVRVIDLVVNPEQPELLVDVTAHINRPEVVTASI
jgi:hypothetical protein